MAIRYCGVPDDPSNPPGLNFITNGSRWNRNNLTYRFNDFSSDISEENVRDAIIAAFELWDNVTRLTFTEITTGTPDILLNFVDNIPPKEEGNPEPLARAYWYPNDDEITIKSEINFNESYMFEFDIPIEDDSHDLVAVAAHEIGHCLGLGHSDIETAIMKSSFFSGTPQRSLDQDDINGIQSIYGIDVSVNKVIGQGGWNGAIAVADGFVYLANTEGNLLRGAISSNVGTQIIGQGGWNGAIAVADGFVYLANTEGNLLRGAISSNIGTQIIGQGGWNGAIAVADGFVYLANTEGNLFRGKL